MKSWWFGGLQTCALLICACSSSSMGPPGDGSSAGVGGAGATGMAGAAGSEGVGGAAGTTMPNCPSGLLAEGPFTGQSPELTPPSCGAFSVEVIVNGVTGREPQKMQQVYNVQVTAEGATPSADNFLLSGFPRPAGYVYRTSSDQIVLAEFVYGTAAPSGRVTFRIRVADGLLNVLASGSGDGTLQLGSTVKMSVTVDPVDSW